MDTDICQDCGSTFPWGGDCCRLRRAPVQVSEVVIDMIEQTWDGPIKEFNELIEKLKKENA